MRFRARYRCGSRGEFGVTDIATPPRLVFDVSTLARSRGQAVGIVRVVRELARWARGNRDDTLFVIFDRQRSLFREVAPGHLDAILAGNELVDTSAQPSGATVADAGRSPGPVARLRPWLRNPRRQAVVALERLRLGRGGDGALAERMISLVASAKLKAELAGGDGRRRTLLPFDVAVGEPAVLRGDQLLLCAGSDWTEDVVDHVERRKAEAGFGLAFVSYDPIPLLFPEFYWAPTAEGFRRFFHRIVPMADIVIVTARQVAADIARYCDEHALRVPEMRAFRPGCDLAGLQPAGDTKLPAGLVPGRYACFVSTIEPRKGHRLLLSTWRRLRAAGIPQAQDFKLVLVGRRGWLVDDLVRDIETDPDFGNNLLVLSDVSDGELAALYRNAAFGLYPSLYEGYGLPVVEMFQNGKAVIASSGGALKEVVGGFSPCLDPRDEEAWFATMRDWILDPAARAPYEAAIAERFRHPTWQEASADFFRILGEEPARAVPADKRG
jgi:glycosyltransferase involved in cell wall biosynthesis